MIKIIVILIKCEGFFCFVNIVVETVGRQCSDIDGGGGNPLDSRGRCRCGGEAPYCLVDQRLQFTSLAADWCTVAVAVAASAAAAIDGGVFDCTPGTAVEPDRAAGCPS